MRQLFPRWKLCFLGLLLWTQTSFANKSTSRPAQQHPSKQQKHQWKQRIHSIKGGLIHQRKLFPTRLFHKVFRVKAPIKLRVLQGIPRTNRYDGIQVILQSGQRQTALLTLQIWRGTRTNVTMRWQKQCASYPQVQRYTHRPLVGRATMTAYRKPRTYLHFQATKRHMIVGIGCLHSICTHIAPLVQFAKEIDRRIH
jgi:hypothetical protein